MISIDDVTPKEEGDEPVDKIVADHIVDTRKLMADPVFRKWLRIRIGQLHTTQRGLLSDFGQGRRDAGQELIDDVAIAAPELWRVSQEEAGR